MKEDADNLSVFKSNVCASIAATGLKEASTRQDIQTRESDKLEFVASQKMLARQKGRLRGNGCCRVFTFLCSPLHECSYLRMCECFAGAYTPSICHHMQAYHSRANGFACHAAMERAAAREAAQREREERENASKELDYIPAKGWETYRGTNLSPREREREREQFVYEGKKDGYVFKEGVRGLGYYRMFRI